MSTMMAWSVGWLAVVVAALGAAGCAQPAEDEAGATDDHLETGGRFTSPLSEGIYDADGAMLSVVNWADRQRVELHVANKDRLTICDATLDISDGAAS